MATEVVVLEEGQRIVEEQRQGPFRAWRHERRFTALSAGETEVSERIDYEPPGGLLGLVLTAARIEADLERAYRERLGRITAMLGGAG
jgi:ligand-binding SRPBCC domain-containing protein